jgi:hypothetical protein
MDTPVSNSLRTTFLIHMIVGLVLGAALWLVPGRTMTLLGWVPAQVPLPESDLSVPGQTFVDAGVTRVLGAAFLALAYSSYLGWRAARHEEVKLLVQTEFVLCVLGTIALLVTAFTLARPFPAIGWVFVVMLAAFAVAWGLALRRS